MLCNRHIFPGYASCVRQALRCLDLAAVVTSLSARIDVWSERLVGRHDFLFNNARSLEGSCRTPSLFAYHMPSSHPTTCAYRYQWRFRRNAFIPFTVVANRIIEPPFNEALDSIAIEIEESQGPADIITGVIAVYGYR